mmetsp:Transcript_28854/g.80675  ORF Transcript_28854/g.80675 Transcript_28854/m.80675 type:complete len:965 (-) Transcript_28854:156-3050(-)|eukprot:CAMPEP_0119137298 /NCGR_PEP_ID=MMETSP1310-20130426/23332_1 /TAXON_ID=464262 /ORGANISM="Genus nov. species nov., Strain RCC2339" /LENGTH=964 /DNA_ID=CAMNT_0007128373 /DNA_START=96 /DNA_END=2990 /DNA_ORIENTATION=-
MASADMPCSLLLSGAAGVERFGVSALKEILEKGDIREKIEAMEQVVVMLLEGEKLHQLLMPVIRYVLPARDHTLKKLVMMYLEIVPKTDAEGKLLSEMILVCNYLRNNLIHPNEYVRGASLRLVTKFKEEELLQPLVPSVRQNLEGRHAYVRKNAVLAILHLYRNFEHLVPDAPDVIYNYLVAETDATCKRNALLMLYECAPETAIAYLHDVMDQVSAQADVIQLVLVQLVRKCFRKYPAHRARHIRCIYTLLQASSAAVRYEAASTLVLLSTASPAIRIAATTLMDILCTHSDTNVKLVILDRLSLLKDSYKPVMQELAMDLLRALATPSLDIRKKTLAVCVELISTRNVEEVVQCLKKEIVKSQDQGMENGAEYRQLLIQAVHSCAIRFPEVAASVVHVLMDFLGDANVHSAVDVINFAREVMELYPDLRQELLQKLFLSIRSIRAGAVFRAALWIIGEHARSQQDIDRALTTVNRILGDMPLVPRATAGPAPEAGGEAAAPEKQASKGETAPRRVLADGTYATQSALAATAAGEADEGAKLGRKHPLRRVILSGDYFAACSLANCLTKMALRLRALDMKEAVKNAAVARILLIMASCLSYGGSGQAPHAIDEDSRRRITTCIRTLCYPSPASERVFLEDFHKSFAELLRHQQRHKAEAEEESAGGEVQVDDTIVVRQLKPKAHGAMGSDDTRELEAHLMQDVAIATREGAGSNAAMQQPRIFQLTGYSDPIYAEVNVLVHQYDIVMDVMVYNQTNDTLQALGLELSTMGDLKLVDRPEAVTLGPRSFTSIRANVKVSSTETGVIYGNIVYDVAGSHAVDSNVIVLNDIHIDIVDYISPATCTEAEFRAMWAEFEWENKVAVKTNITDIQQYLNHIIKQTNMKCLTKVDSIDHKCDFVAATLYARSVFGESALVNIGAEKQSDGKLSGHIRIRSKTQGIALSLGDKITLKQNASEVSVETAA